MNQLNKLIEQFERENPGKKAFHERIFVGGSIRVYHEEFVLWLASRPTCGKEQRKFLDEVEKLAVNESNTYHPTLLDDFHSVLFTSDFKCDLQKVIKGK